MSSGKRPYRCQIARLGAVPCSKLLASQVTTRSITGGESGHSRSQRIAPSGSNDDADFQTLIRIGGSDRVSVLHGCAFASLQNHIGHRFLVSAYESITDEA